MRVHNTLGPGFLESAFQNALLHELQKAGVPVEPEKRVRVVYDGILVGDFISDILADSRILVENKAVRSSLRVVETPTAGAIADRM